MQKYNILIVERINIDIQDLNSFFADYGYEFLTSKDLKQARKISEETQIDLFCLNYAVFAANPGEVNYLLPRKSTLNNTPAIFVTRSRLTIEKLQNFKLESVDYILEPIKFSELLIKIDRLLKIEKLNSQLVNEIKNRQLVREIADCICKSLDLYFIFQTTVEAIIKVLPCDRLTIVSLEDKDISVKAQSVAKHISGKLPPKLDFDYCRSLIAKQQHFPKLDIRKVKVEQKELIADNIPAQLSAPIVLKKTRSSTKVYYPLWGWLIAERASRKRWQQEEIDLINSLTAQLAIALRQSLLYQQLKQNNEELRLSNQQLKSTNEQLEELALLDSLTKIFNRRYFDRHLNQEWLRLQRNAPSHLSLILCDVDYFKVYNDTYGHKQGDRCLQELARVFDRVLRRPADILARYGGEEFAIILPDTPQTGAVKIANTLRMAAKNSAIPHLNSAIASIVTVSLGIASIAFKTENTPDLLIEAADQALYSAKSRGRDCIAVYQGNVAHSKRSQNNELYWSQRIRQALEQNLFSLYAQPIVPLNNSLAKGNCQQHFEILLRLTDTDEKIINPDAFFSIAARNSLMPKIDMWVIDRLLAVVAEFNYDNWQNHYYSINLSGASLNNWTFLNRLVNKLDRYHLPGKTFCFEITENIAINNLNTVARFINSVKEIGCSFALDDFGKGMSSLSYIKNLPIDYVKIDGSFIKDIEQDLVSQTIVEGIHHIAKGIGLKTVAEFVENQKILDTLRNLEIDYAQGYYLGHPAKLTDILSQNH